MFFCLTATLNMLIHVNLRFQLQSQHYIEMPKLEKTHNETQKWRIQLKSEESSIRIMMIPNWR